MQVKKQQLEPDMKQQTGSNLRKEYVKAIYCHPTCLTYMQSTSCEILAWVNHKLESRLHDISIIKRNINYLRYADDSTLMAEYEEEQKSLLMKMKKESAKASLKLSIQKN